MRKTMDDLIQMDDAELSFYSEKKSNLTIDALTGISPMAAGQTDQADPEQPQRKKPGRKPSRADGQPKKQVCSTVAILLDKDLKAKAEMAAMRHHQTLTAYITQLLQDDWSAHGEEYTQYHRLLFPEQYKD